MGTRSARVTSESRVSYEHSQRRERLLRLHERQGFLFHVKLSSQQAVVQPPGMVSQALEMFSEALADMRAVVALLPGAKEASAACMRLSRRAANPLQLMNQNGFCMRVAMRLMNRHEVCSMLSLDPSSRNRSLSASTH